MNAKANPIIDGPKKGGGGELRQPCLGCHASPAAPPPSNSSHFGLKAGHGAGVAAIGEQIAGGNFLDLLKIQKQRAMAGTPASYGALARQLGPGGLWRGMWPWGAGMYGSRGLLLGAGHAAAEPRVRRAFPTWSQSSTLAAASAAGGALEGAITSPLAQMRTRALEQMERGAALPRPTPAQLLRPLPAYSLKRALDGACAAGSTDYRRTPRTARPRAPPPWAAPPRSSPCLWTGCCRCCSSMRPAAVVVGVRPRQRHALAICRRRGTWRTARGTPCLSSLLWTGCSI